MTVCVVLLQNCQLNEEQTDDEVLGEVTRIVDLKLDDAADVTVSCWYYVKLPVLH